jgi:CHAD domain-containing protein
LIDSPFSADLELEINTLSYQPLKAALMATAKKVRRVKRGAVALTHPAGDAFSVIRSIFLQTRHLHGLTKTSLKLLRLAAQLEAEHTQTPSGSNGKPTSTQRALAELPASQRQIVHAALDAALDSSSARPHAGPLSSKPKAIASIGLRIGAILQLADAVTHLNPSAAGVGVQDDGQSLGIHVPVGPDGVEGTPDVTDKTALWNRVALRPCELSMVTGAARAPAWIRQDQAMAEAGRHVLQRHLEYFLSRQYGLPYMADVEYVHELRVATRRLRAAVRMFGRAFRGRLKGPAKRLRTLAVALGRARDCDVFLLFLRGYTKKNPKAERWLKGLLRAQKRTRAQAYAALRRELSTPATQRFLRTWHEGLQGGAEELVPTSRGLDRPVTAVARKSLRRALARVHRYGRKLESLTVDQQHVLRIDCKKLRYSAEFVAELYPPQLEQLLTPAIQLQDLLGEAHDADLYAHRIADYFRRSRRAKSVKVMRAIRKHLLARRRRCLLRAGKLWRSFTADRTQTTLAQLIESVGQ